MIVGYDTRGAAVQGAVGKFVVVRVGGYQTPFNR
jgi:hypothetical protein